MIRRRRLNNDYVGKGGYPLGCLGGNLGFGSEILSGSVSHRTKSGASSSFSFSFTVFGRCWLHPHHHTTPPQSFNVKTRRKRKKTLHEERREEKRRRPERDTTTTRIDICIVLVALTCSSGGDGGGGGGGGGGLVSKSAIQETQPKVEGLDLDQDPDFGVSQTQTHNFSISLSTCTGVGVSVGVVSSIPERVSQFGDSKWQTKLQRKQMKFLITRRTRRKRKLA